MISRAAVVVLTEYNVRLPTTAPVTNVPVPRTARSLPTLELLVAVEFVTDSKSVDGFQLIRLLASPNT